MKNQNNEQDYANILDNIFNNLSGLIDDSNQKIFKDISNSFVLREIDQTNKGILITTNNNLHKIILVQKFGEIFNEAVKTVLKEKYSIEVKDEDEYKLENKSSKESFKDKLDKLEKKSSSLQSKKTNFSEGTEEFNNFEQIEKNSVNKEKTFENYIISDSNKLIYKAAKDISSEPGGDWNPLFIYGNSGLGKTHLLHAIGNSIINKFPDYKIKYIPARKFAEIIHNAIKSQKTNAVLENIKAKYLQFDVLLVDDIQFIKDWPKAKEIFFHIFNSFIEDKKQVVLVSDTYPQNLSKDGEGFEQRFITRFTKGLTMGINPPDKDGAKQIIKYKFKNTYKFNLEDVEEEAINYIADNFSASINELEGAITKIIFYSINSTEKENKINMELMNEAFKNVYSAKSKIEFTDIIDEVSKYYGISKSELFSKSRKKIIMTARQISIYFSRDLLNYSLVDIGKKFERNHSTIINSINKIEKEKRNNEQFNQALSKIRGLILR